MSKDLTLKQTKGVSVINSKTPEQMKEYRKEVIEYTRSLIEKGITNYGAKKEALMKKFSVTDRMAKKYIKYAKEDIEKRRYESQQERRDNMLIQWDGIYREAMQLGDTKSAIEALKEIAKIEGQYAAKQINVSQDVKHTTDLSHLSAEQLLMIQNMIDKPNNTIDIGHEEV